MVGQTLAHYRIVEKIGAGGMGEVYRAHDEQLDRDVALKVLPAGTLSDEAARKRFRKEALALARLNHPNIGTVYEFGTQNSVDFLAMELVPGATLSERLKNGPLEEREVLRLGMEIAEGLAAAHERGVVHRDLKPANIIVTPNSHPKLLDFGLAKLLHPKSDAASTESTLETQVAGTLPYMAPEQLRGELIDARTDIYAVGAVLYEMATGRRPFPETQSPKLIEAILHQTPTSPGTHNRNVKPALQSVILKALEKEPARRYQSAHELLAALDGIATSLHPSRTRTPAALKGAATVPLKGRYIRIVGGVALVLVMVAGLFFGLNLGRFRDRLLHRGQPGKEAAGPAVAPVKARPAVAVLGFKNLSGRPDEEWLSTAFSEMLSTELAAGEQLRTVSGENVTRVKIDLSLPDAESYAPDTLGRIHKNLGTDYVVFGSYIVLGKQSGEKIRLDVRLQNAGNGETIASVAESGTAKELFDVASKAGAHLREKMGVGEVSVAEAREVHASLPSNQQAVRFYSEGLAKLRVLDGLAARDLLQKAVAADPNSALAHSALSAAWSILGYGAKASEEAKQAFQLSASLSREARLLVEARFRETTNEWDKAIEICRSLFRFFPDNLEYGLHLASVQISAARGHDALTTVEALRRLPSRVSDDPRIDLAEAAAAQSISDFKREQVAASNGALKATANGARLQIARARLMEGWSALQLGDPKQAVVLCQEAKQIYAVAGDRGGVAGALNNLGIVLDHQGDAAGALEAYQLAFAIRSETGNKKEMSATLNNMALVLLDRGDLGEARKKFEEALAIKRAIDDKRGAAALLNNLGVVLKLQGDLRGAGKRYQAALATYREIGLKSGIQSALDNIASVLVLQGHLTRGRQMILEALKISRAMSFKEGTAANLADLAWVLYLQGDLKGAQNTLDEALSVLGGGGKKSYFAQIHSKIGEVSFAEGDLTRARKEYEQALNAENELKAKGDAAEDLVRLARLSIEEGNPAEAEAGAGRAIAEFRAEKLADAEALGHGVLAHALLALGKRSEAAKEIVFASRLVATSQNQLAHFQVTIDDARVRATLRETAEAKKYLRAVLAEATRLGFLGYAFEAQLMLGEIETKAGNTQAGRAQLSALEKNAAARGFMLVARKAAAAYVK